MTIEKPGMPYHLQFLPPGNPFQYTLSMAASGHEMQQSPAQLIEATEVHYHDHAEHCIAVVGSSHHDYHKEGSNLEAVEAFQALLLLGLFIWVAIKTNGRRRKRNKPAG